MPVGQLLGPSHRSRCFGGCAAAGLVKNNALEDRRCCRLLTLSPSPCAALQCLQRRDVFTLIASNQILKPLIYASHGHNCFSCHSFPRPECLNDIITSTGVAFTRSHVALHEYPLLFQLAPAFGIIAFAVWGLEPVMRLSRKLLYRNDDDWKKSRTRHTMNSYLQPFLLWTGVILICRSLDPISLTSEASQTIKQRLLNFVKSLSTVLAFAFCASRLMEQIQKFYMDQFPTSDTRNMGFQFVGKAIYTAMWVAAISLFMEMLGFSTQKWLTAGGLGTVLLTLAGREIFTNFLSSLMIHATRPFVKNDWIQAKIEGYEVSGTVEHVGWWSPTVVRGEDQEAIHIPNLKFTVNVIRNLSQKMHWRIKTHLAISHLDANKISNIVADMRKVLAKNPQIEQQRIHRRIFLDYIDTENQAFMILVSCFVRTSHIEEYLRVKEVVLVDLLKVIRHHRARLATPIRTYQKASNGINLEEVTSEMNSNLRRHPPYLLDTSSTINSGDKTKSQKPTLILVEQPPNAAGGSEQSPNAAGGSKQPLNAAGGPKQKAADVIVVDSNSANMDKQVVISDKNSSASKRSTTNSEHGWCQNNVIKVASEKKIPTASKPGPELSTCKKDAADRKSVSQVEEENGLAKHLDGEQVNHRQPQSTTQSKKESERTQTRSTPASRPLEDNIVLGMALDGEKRTLPIDEDVAQTPQNTKQLISCKNGSKLPLLLDKKDAQTTSVDTQANEGRGQEKRD